jgi:gluconokinase
MIRVIVMGVSGCGKTTFGEELADRLGQPFVEGDRLHPQANVAKMSAGIPLTDEDRWPWLDLVGTALAAKGDAVGSCSALRRVYRDRLRRAAGPALRFVCLMLPRDELERRMRERSGHFMPPALLDSQLATFEPPLEESDVLIVDGTLPVSQGVEQAKDWLRAGFAEDRA